MSVALVVGCAECVWDDAQKALALFTPDAVFAVKDQMVHWPGRIDHGVTLHPDRVGDYLKRRREKGRSVDFPVWAHKRHRNLITHVTQDWQGSSGLLAIKVALVELKFNAVVLVGCPMEEAGGHIVRRKKWTSANLFYRGWIKRQKELEPYVRSMSGWTMKIFKAPTLNWLKSMGALPPDPALTTILPMAERLMKV